MFEFFVFYKYNENIYFNKKKITEINNVLWNFIILFAFKFCIIYTKLFSMLLLLYKIL